MTRVSYEYNFKMNWGLNWWWPKINSDIKTASQVLSNNNKKINWVTYIERGIHFGYMKWTVKKNTTHKHTFTHTGKKKKGRRKYQTHTVTHSTHTNIEFKHVSSCVIECVRQENWQCEPFARYGRVNHKTSHVQTCFSEELLRSFVACQSNM